MNEIRTTIRTVQKSYFARFVGCDGCSARSKFLVQFSSGQLAFCAHHFSKHEQVIRTVSVSVLKIEENADSD